MSLPKPYYQRGPVTLYHGDCLELLPHLPRVDAVVTDPPYGVGFVGKRYKQRNGEVNHREGGYVSAFEDTPEYVKAVAVSVVEWCIDKGVRALVTPGTRCLMAYPQPAEVGCLFAGSGGGLSSWGFRCSQPILFYGADPYLQNGMGARPNSMGSTYPNDANDVEHPCAKPIRQVLWMVERASLSKETILDPFLGSGTTAVACIRTGRQCIGIELEEKYCEIAAKRCDRELDQKRLPFDKPTRTETQRALFAEVTA